MRLQLFNASQEALKEIRARARAQRRTRSRGNYSRSHRRRSAGGAIEQQFFYLPLEHIPASPFVARYPRSYETSTDISTNLDENKDTPTVTHPHPEDIADLNTTLKETSDLPASVYLEDTAANMELNLEHFVAYFEGDGGPERWSRGLENNQ